MPMLRTLSRTLLAAAVLALPACSDSTGSKAGPAAHVDVVSGNAQTGAVNTQLPQPLVVKVTDAGGKVVKGRPVSFVVTAGGGQVSAGTATTDQSGLAQTLWTLGCVAGSPQTVEARAVSGTGQVLASATFTATATPGAPAQAAAYGPSAASGDTLVAGVVGAAVEDSFAVIVRDAAGNPVPGAQVAWAVTSGGGSITTPTTTNASGVARTQWVLGASTAPQTAQATVGGSTVRFTAYPATTLTKTLGDGVTAGTGSTLTVTLSATGASGAIGGLPIHWTVSSGGGSVTPAVGETSRQAFNYGTASASWTLGASTGTQTLTATAGGLSVTFTATAVLAGTRTLLAQVPDLALDATSDRVLWLQGQVGTGLVKLRTLATGTDSVVLSSSGPTNATGYLFTGGALVLDGSSTLFEYRAGTLTNLGAVFGIFSADGEWAAWSDGAKVIRRDLSTGTNLVLANARGFFEDAAPNGDVAFVTAGAYVYHAGTLTPVSTTGPATRAETDGVNVVYSGFDGISVKAYRDNGNADELLFSSPNGGEYRLNGGWIAWSTPGSPVQRRTPAGVIETVSPETSGTLLDALGPDGTVVYRAPRNGGRYFLVTPAGARYDLGPAGDTDRVVVHGSTFFLLSGGSAYRLAP